MGTQEKMGWVLRSQGGLRRIGGGNSGEKGLGTKEKSGNLREKEEGTQKKRGMGT